VVADGLDHQLAAWLAAGVAMGVEGVDELVSSRVNLLEVARKPTEPLLHLGLVLLARPVKVMSLQLVGQVGS
jgi:hypothetical protein